MKNTIKSVLTKNQKKTFGPKIYTEQGTQYRITAKVRYDDECNNGHNSFSIAGEIYRKRKSGGWEVDSFGCLHEQIAKHFPELAHLIKWHLCASDGPMYYLENTLYHAGDKDCHGLRKGEFKQHTSRGDRQNGGIEGVPNWVLEIPEDMKKDVYAEKCPEPVTLHWKPYGRTSEGKTLELQHARSCAIWPEATDEDLLSPDLRQKLIDRLPGLMAEFQKVIEDMGFVF